MKNILFLIAIFYIGIGFSQTPITLDIDSSSLNIVDTTLRVKTDYAIYIQTNKDYPSGKMILTIFIMNSDSVTVIKRYDIAAKQNISTTTSETINGKIYFNGPYRFYSAKKKITSFGTYKMDYLDGIAIIKDSTGQIRSKKVCNSKRKTCKVVQYYANGNLKAKYQTKEGETLKFGKFISYYDNGIIKEKGQYRIIKIDTSSIDWILKIPDNSLINNGQTYFKIGTWKYYNENSSLKKQEEYSKNGKLLQE